MAKIAKWLSHPRLPWFLAALATVLALPSLWVGLLLDDYWHYAVFRDVPILSEQSGPLEMFSFVKGDPEHTRTLIDLGVCPWWTNEDLRLSFWRPVTALTHWLDYTLWPEHPWLMHLQSLAWMGALVIVVTLLYRRLMGVGPVAGLAALGYAVDDAHAMPVGWIANRNGLLAAFFGVCTILLHDRWRRDGRLPAALLAILCLAIGVQANEGAIAACAYLLAYAVFIDRGRPAQRALSLVPYAVVVLVWRAWYQWAGYGAWGSAAYIDPVASPLRFLKGVLVRGPVLLLGQWAVPPADVFTFIPTAAQPLLLIAAVTVILVLSVLFFPLLRRNAMARFWCLGMVLALVPSCATFPSDRLLLFSGLGAMGLLALLLGPAGREIYLSAPVVPRVFAKSLCAFLIIVHFILAPVLLPVTILGFSRGAARVTDAIDGLRLGDEVVDQTVVVVNSPSVFINAHLPLLKTVRGEPVPAYVRGLGPSTFFLITPIRLTRPDEHTLIMQPDGGYPWFLFRDADHPFAVGDRVELTGMTVEVTKLTDDGRPLEVAFHFSVPLEDPSLVWFVWFQVQDAFEPFTPPAVGETIMLNESRSQTANEEL